MANDILIRSAEILPNTFNREARTFVATLATAAPIQRRGGFESLDLASMELPASAPILLDHRATVNDTVGRASNIRRDGDTIVADCRISGDPALASLCERIADGTVSGMSIGYAVPRWNESRSATGERTRIALGAVLRHAALVAEPADAGAGIRSLDEPDDRDQRIQLLCRMLDVSRDIEVRALTEQWTDEQIRNHVRGRQHDIHTTRRGLDDPETYHRAAVDGLVARMTNTEAQGPARELQSLSWPELHRRHLRQAGHSVAGLSDVEVITRALSTSDMPIIAGEATNIMIRRTYDAALSAVGVVFGTRDLPDFRPRTEALVDWTTLATGAVGENSEFKTSYVSESGESYFVATRGGITNVSRQLYINGAAALGNLSTAQGRRLAADVSDLMVGYITQNTLAGPDMSDTNPVFETPGGRGNVASLDDTDIGTIINSVLVARAAMPKRVGAGNVMIGQFPRYWIVPTEFEGNAVRALATINPVDSANVNPLTGRLEVIPEPRLTSTTTSYLVCAPAVMDGVVRVNLSGAPGPYTELRWGFEIDAVQFKIRLDIGLGWVEWRSWTRLDHS